jgi:hypothetical protein
MRTIKLVEDHPVAEILPGRFRFNRAPAASAPLSLSPARDGLRRAINPLATASEKLRPQQSRCGVARPARATRGGCVPNSIAFTGVTRCDPGEWIAGWRLEPDLDDAADTHTRSMSGSLLCGVSLMRSARSFVKGEPFTRREPSGRELQQPNVIMQSPRSQSSCWQARAGSIEEAGL